MACELCSVWAGGCINLRAFGRRYMHACVCQWMARYDLSEVVIKPSRPCCFLPLRASPSSTTPSDYQYTVLPRLPALPPFTHNNTNTNTHMGHAHPDQASLQVRACMRRPSWPEQGEDRAP